MLFELHEIVRVGLEPLTRCYSSLWISISQKIYRDYATPLLDYFASFSFLIRCLEMCVCVCLKFLPKSLDFLLVSLRFLVRKLKFFYLLLLFAAAGLKRRKSLPFYIFSRVIYYFAPQNFLLCLFQFHFWYKILI